MRKCRRPDQDIESVQLSRHFQLASDQDRVVYLGMARSASHNAICIYMYSVVECSAMDAVTSHTLGSNVKHMSGYHY